MPKKAHPERMIQNAILQFLRLQRDLVAWEVDNQGRFDRKTRRFLRRGVNGGGLFYTGISDILMLHKKFGFIALEVKSKVGVLSSDQKDFRDAIEKNGGHFFMVRSVEDVEEAFVLLEKKLKPAIS